MPVDMTSSSSQIFLTTQEGRNHVLFHFSIKVRSYAKSLFFFAPPPVAPAGKFILILDGLNQLEDRDNAPNLGWLPNYFPPNIRVILSSLPGPSLNALKKRDWPEFQVHGLESSERKILIEDYLGGYRKTLSPQHL